MTRPAGTGRFIVLEGLDGAGTTTQAQKLGIKLQEEGYRVLVTCEPTDRPVGRLIRQALTRRLTHRRGDYSFTNQTLALLFAADRLDHLHAEIVPALESGRVVICDRYLLSSLAYQGTSIVASWIERINQFAIPPDLTLFLDVDPQIAASRRVGRVGADELFDAAELQAQIARRYRAVTRRHRSSHRVVRIDASKSIEEVTEGTMRTVQRVLKPTSSRGRDRMPR